MRPYPTSIDSSGPDSGGSLAPLLFTVYGAASLTVLSSVNSFAGLFFVPVFFLLILVAMLLKVASVRSEEELGGVSINSVRVVSALGIIGGIGGAVGSFMNFRTNYFQSLLFQPWGDELSRVFFWACIFLVIALLGVAATARSGLNAFGRYHGGFGFVEALVQCCGAAQIATAIASALFTRWTDIATFFGLAYSVLSLIYGALLLRRNFSTPVGRLLGATVTFGLLVYCCFNVGCITTAITQVPSDACTEVFSFGDEASLPSSLMDFLFRGGIQRADGVQFLQFCSAIIPTALSYISWSNENRAPSHYAAFA